MIVDMLLSESGYTGGSVIHSDFELWSKGVSGGDRQQIDMDVPFDEWAPYTVPVGDPHAGEQPWSAEGQFTWWVGLPTVAGQRQRDSFDFRYPVKPGNSYDNEFGGPFLGAAFGRTEFQRTTTPGSVVGPSGLRPGEVGNFRVITHWDTSGYNFKWHVDNMFTNPDTFATFAKSFGSTGTYTLRVDQILADGNVLSSTRSVKVYNASISGPSSVKPFATCSWSASASDGTSPYSYAWQAVSTTGSGQWFEFTNGVVSGGSFNILLMVTDASGAIVAVSKNVSVSSSAPACAS